MVILPGAQESISSALVTQFNTSNLIADMKIHLRHANGVVSASRKGTMVIIIMYNATQYVKGKNTSHTSPGSTPGLNPCNHLAWLACGPWRTHIQAWHGMAWYGMAWGCGLRSPPHHNTLNTYR